MITKVVFTVAITLGTGLGIAAPASADPSSFGALGCNCTQPIAILRGKSAVKDQVSRGLQSGRGSLHAGSANLGAASTAQ